MANVNVFLMGVMMIVLFVNKSNADISTATCSTTDTCSSLPNAECTGTTDLTCTCKTGTNNVNDVCILPLEGDCSGNLECNTENAECTGGKCACKSDYKPTTGNAACEQKGLDDACAANTDCKNVPNAECTSETCSCADGYIKDDTACTQVHGSECSGSEPCPGLSNSICSGDSCGCAQFYKVESNVCVPIPVTDIECSSNGNEDCPENAVCVDEMKCQCEVGFKMNGNQCSDSGAASTVVMMGMIFSSLMVLLTNKLVV